MARKIDWRAYLNRLTYCYGCGKFGLPRKGKPRPMGWKLLYQPHDGAPPGLHVCSESCANQVREAMAKGPVHEPLQMGPPPMMDAGLRQQMMGELREEFEKNLVRENHYTFECVGCEKRISPMQHDAHGTSLGIPLMFDCPNPECDVTYKTGGTGVPGMVRVKTAKPEESPT